MCERGDRVEWTASGVSLNSMLMLNLNEKIILINNVNTAGECEGGSVPYGLTLCFR